MELDGIIFTPSTRKNKKYMAEFPDGTKVHFGDKRYQHYFDRIGKYSYLNHYSDERRMNYLIRHRNDLKLDENGKINKKTPGYLAMTYLW